MGEWVRGLIEDGGYSAIALLMFLETIFPPIPSEVIMSFAGLSAARGHIGLPGAIAAGTAGAMLGNVAWYAAARALGLERLRPLVERHGRWLTLDWASVARADALFDRYDRWFVFIGRMTPTLRSLVSVPAGLFGMGWRPFLVWSTLGTLGWSSALAVAGWQLGARYGDVERWLDPIATVVLVLLVGGYLVRVATWRPRG